MKPTIEEINTIFKNVISAITKRQDEEGKLFKNCEEIYKFWVSQSIEEWEKLKNQPKEDICKDCPFLGYEGSGEICTIYYKLQNYDLAHLGCNEQRINNCPIKDIRK